MSTITPTAAVIIIFTQLFLTICLGIYVRLMLELHRINSGHYKFQSEEYWRERMAEEMAEEKEAEEKKAAEKSRKESTL